MTVKNVTALAEELERHLGDPHDPANLFSFERVLHYDEREVEPTEVVQLLQSWNLHQYCLPARWGGRAGDVEAGFNLMRLVSRRDAVVAASMNLTHLAFTPIWVAGSEEQRRRFVDTINHGVRMSWGLTERTHGSDILANEMRAEKVDGGYLVTGEKWLIGNAGEADLMTMHVRTNSRGGPGDWSLLVLDKRLAPAGTVVELPRERLHGLRSLDVSGIRVENVFVPDENLIGAEGHGLEIALKSSQVARTVITGMALGITDTALRVTLDFITERVLFGQKVSEIPYTRRQVAECFADLVLADSACTGAVRGLQAYPDQVSLTASMVKYHAPTLMERVMSQLNNVLGARIYLRSHPHFGIYQKMLRDVLVPTFADGNTVVNLKNIALQLDGILRGDANATPEQRAEARLKIAPMFDVDAELGEWAPWKMALFGRDGDATVLALPPAIEELRAFAAAHPDAAQRGWFERACDVAGRLLGELETLRVRQTELKKTLGKEYGQSAELLRLTEQYAAIHVAAATVHMTVNSRDAFSAPFPDGALTLLCLERAWRTFHPAEPVTDAGVVDQVMEVLLTLHRERRLFSPWQFQLSASGLPAGTAF